MNPDHPRWGEFLDRLEEPDGCNFRKNKDGETVWDCAGGTDKSFAERILQEMSDIDLEATFALFEEHGGFCDCEILMNVEDSFEEAAKLPAKIERKRLKQQEKQLRRNQSRS